MKKLFSIAIITFCIAISFAQKVSPSRAYNLYYDKDFVKAKECIDACINDEN